MAETALTESERKSLDWAIGQAEQFARRYEINADEELIPDRADRALNSVERYRSHARALISVRARFDAPAAEPSDA